MTEDSFCVICYLASQTKLMSRSFDRAQRLIEKARKGHRSEWEFYRFRDDFFFVQITIVLFFAHQTCFDRLFYKVGNIRWRESGQSNSSDGPHIRLWSTDHFRNIFNVWKLYLLLTWHLVIDSNFTVLSVNRPRPMGSSHKILPKCAAWSVWIIWRM